jgi:hypothetical protein
MIPKKAEDKNDTLTNKLRSFSILKLIASKKKDLPKPSANDPEVVKRISKSNKEDKRCSFWDEGNDINVDNSKKFDTSLEKFKIALQESNSIALEFDMSKIKPEQKVYQELIKALKLMNPSATIDEGQKAIGLLMLYGGEFKDNPLVIPGIIALKKGSEYMREREALSSLVNRNLSYINPEALISLWLGQGMSLEQIAFKLNIDLNAIQGVYGKIQKRLEEEKIQMKKEQLSITMNIFVKELIDNAIGAQKKPTIEKTLKDLSLSEEEDWDL